MGKSQGDGKSEWDEERRCEECQGKEVKREKKGEG